jgi:hypothetical protein
VLLSWGVPVCEVAVVVVLVAGRQGAALLDHILAASLSWGGLYNTLTDFGRVLNMPCGH